MLMEGGGGSIVINNLPLSAVAAAVLNGSERAYDRSSPLLDNAKEEATVLSLTRNTTMTSTTSVVHDNTNVIAAAVDGKQKGITHEQDEAASNCSAVMGASCSFMSSAEVCGSSSKVAECAITEPGFPAIGSPPADLMVVNTNGFNPLQHAALRGNPG